MNLRTIFVCAGLTLASASLVFPQSYSRYASFTLPYEARWNAVLLQPGEYELFIPDAASLPQTIRIVKDGQTICLLPSVETSSTPATSGLRLTKVGHVAVVTDLDLSEASKSFHFSPSKIAREQLAASREHLTTKTLALISAAK